MVPYLLQAPSHVKDMKFFIGHGTSDPLIPAPLASKTEEIVKQKGRGKIQQIKQLLQSLSISRCPSFKIPVSGEAC